MRWLPRSLFSRMVLVLLGGLVVAQLVSFAIHWEERGELVLRTTGMRSAQRIADIVRLLGLPDVRERLEGQGVEIAATSPAQFEKFIREEIVRWGKAVKVSGAKPE